MPGQPTEIIGFELTDEWVEVTGKDFSFGGRRDCTGIKAGTEPNSFLMVGVMLCATIYMPEKRET